VTEYVVLWGNEGSVWHEQVRVHARSDRAAIREALKEVGEPHRDQWLAVPARSFRPVTVKVETKTALRFS
jgi:hypothetical protein